MKDRLAAARQNGGLITLCLCDVDRFKNVNDTWGHQTGDRVLAALARTIREGIRGSDLAGRMGGDEFCLLFVGATPDQAAQVVERVRSRFEAIVFGTHSPGVFGVTASFGLAGFTAEMNEMELLEAADRALYEAKKKGRNLVSVHGAGSGSKGMPARAAVLMTEPFR